MPGRVSPDGLQRLQVWRTYCHMGLKRSRPRDNVRDPLYRVWGFFEKRQRAWWAANVGFERKVVVVVDGTRWMIIYKTHAVRSGGDRSNKHTFKSSITVWPAKTTGTGKRVRVPDGSDSRRLKDWRQKYQQRIRRHGYRGQWQESPVGQFGDFWKTLKDAEAVAVEVELLNRMRI